MGERRAKRALRSERLFIPLLLTPNASHSLAKVRYEQEAWAKCQRYTDQLRQMGFYSIIQLMPLSRMIMLFQRLDPPMPNDLLSCSKAVVMTLRSKANMKLLGGTEVRNQWNDLQAGNVSIGQVMHNFDGEHTQPQAGVEAKKQQVEEQLAQADGGGTMTSSVTRGDASQPAVGEEEDYEVEEEKPFPPTFADVTYQEYTPDPDTPRLLEDQLLDNVEGWGGVDDPIDNFLTQAAFYVVPHVESYDAREQFRPAVSSLTQEEPEGLGAGSLGGSLGEEEKKEGSVEFTFNTSEHTLGEPKKSKMGPTAFTEFCKELVAVSKESTVKGKDLMRRRTQQAMVLSSKYTMRFKDAGVTKVRHLLQVIFEEWGFPPPLANQA